MEYMSMTAVNVKVDFQELIVQSPTVQIIVETMESVQKEDVFVMKGSKASIVPLCSVLIIATEEESVKWEYAIVKTVSLELIVQIPYVQMSAPESNNRFYF